MKRQILISSLILLSIQTFAAAAILLVPQQYNTIQSAINASSDGDIIVVKPGTYTGYGNRDIDFGKGLTPSHTRAITVTSYINPDNPNPDIIASTIIDCQGTEENPHRAFTFERGEGNDSKVLGFTIINGYAQGPRGGDGADDYSGDPLSNYVPEFICAGEDTCPPIADHGDNAVGDGYGGAIRCIDASSPAIKHCVIKNCTVTGAQGGRGGHGQNGPWYHWTLADIDPCTGQIDTSLPQTENTSGQWGGRGGDGYGNGYGGAIACRESSSPIIIDCNISYNIARGGCGGDGGNGGNADSTGVPPTYQGTQSFGGDGGNSFGDGIGGGIYAEDSSNPIITNCTFKSNTATTGARASGGLPGQGNVIPVDVGGPATAGTDGRVYSSRIFDGNGISGGAAYFRYPSDAQFTNCTFTGNKAYEAYVFYNPLAGNDISAYTVGGALYSENSNIVDINTCNFTSNLGGAIYCESNCNLNFDDCLFTGNSDPHDGTDSHLYILLRELGYDIGIGMDFGSGGAIYIGSGCTADLQNCGLGGNSTKNNGGALECRSSATLANCSFGGNKADSGNDGSGRGGGMNAYNYGTNLTVDFNACIFVDNQAVFGGGTFIRKFDANFTDCYFISNTAWEGGGLEIADGNLIVTGGSFNGNNAIDGYGGGIMCSVSKAEISNCVIRDNSASGYSIFSGNGGAINFYGGFVTHRVKNCLITGNTSSIYGGCISCELFAEPEIQNCTFSGNSAGVYGGAIFADWSSLPQITDCIFEGCNKHAIHEEDFGGDASATFCLFYNNSNGDYYESDTSTSYNFNSVADPNGNFNKNPRFVSGDLGGYYLSQIDAGQSSNSPAINNGSDTAANLGLDTFTTRTNNGLDNGQVDRGYHYPDSNGVETFELTASVIGGNGTITFTPASGPYYAGSIVTLTAIPNPGWRVKGWTGTFNDASTSTTNTVIMNSNKTVTVRFEQPKTHYVAIGGGEGYHSTIQDAIAVAKDGDTVVVYPGTYFGAYFGVSVSIDKSITVRSLNPDDPCCVAATIIDGYLQSPFEEGHTNVGVEFVYSTDENTIFNGFTIQNCGGGTRDAENGERTPRDHPDGFDGGWGIGSGIVIYPGGSPIIKNCIIRDNVIRAGDAGDGVPASETQNAGRGGWGGFAWGGGVYCGYNSSPTFINCRIIDNEVQGGDGGNGGNDAYPGGEENYGGNWSIRGTVEFPAYNIDPHSLTITPVTDSNLWELWEWDGGGSYLGDYRWYSGYGGGVFIDQGSNVTFIGCEITGNTAKGGMSGQGGEDFYSERPLEPLIPFEIPSFGGGVYCAAYSTVTFNDCTITDNISSEPNDPPINRIDLYLGHGGGVCAEDTAELIFTDCTFSQNFADAGGGLHFANANTKISNCNFTLNSANHGGGLFGLHGLSTILRSDFTNNMAISDVNDPNTLGTGGGLHLISTEVDIIDCNISGNQADSSGGGAFFSGENNSSFKNCLLTNNSAGTRGGGISSNIFSSLTISNCTIAYNLITETGGYGGGLHSSYNSYTNIINSIFWGNSSQYGPQLALIGIGGNPSGAAVSYSNVQGGQYYVFIDEGCTLNWDPSSNIHINPLFVTGPLGYYYLSQIAAGQSVTSDCVNIGSDSAKNLGMDRHTTRTDEQPDRKTVDMGYHHQFSPDAQPCRFCELFRDSIINFKDFAIFALNWLNEGCSGANEYCQHADMTLDTYVDFEDLALFAECWLAEDNYPPVPNPSEWEIQPYPSWSSEYPDAISMLAQTAYDAWDFWVGDVQYYFDCVSGGCNDSGWQNEPNYIDYNLVVGAEYGYRVRARDASGQIPNDETGQPGNKTDWSPIRYAIAGEEPIEEDLYPPEPDPMTWATVPTATGTTSITMAATAATDETPPVMYYFECTSDGTASSNWRADTTYTATGLTPETEYTFWVRARDGVTPTPNITGWSTLASATTLEEGEEPEVDTNPPTPVEWEVLPFETGGGLNAYANMTAAEATDPEGNGPVQYYFECDDDELRWVNSGWTEERVWNNVPIGPSGKYLMFHFKVRDNAEPRNESNWSTSMPCY